MNLAIADVLSRALCSSSTTEDYLMQDESKAYLQLTMQNLPATEKRLLEIRRRMRYVEYCQEGWPGIKSVPKALKTFYPVAAELSIQLMRGARIVIPVSMQSDILEKLHVGHQGIRRCRERAKQSECPICINFRSQKAEPLIPTQLPNLPWQMVATDLFEWKKATYLLIVDYYSRWIKIAKLTGLTANSVINHTKSIFARYGIPEKVISDNGL